MTPQLMELLLCPFCGKVPQLFAFDDGPEVLSGILRCSCGRAFPVIDGVPRFLERGLEQFPDFAERYRGRIEAAGCTSPAASATPVRDDKNDYDNIRKSFSQEWGVFDYDTDKTWGWSLDERKQVFLDDVKLTPDQLSSRTVLDAGCGNGTLTAALSAFGFRIVGLDLNDGLGRAYANRAKYSKNALTHVQYVQGNIVAPPLKAGSFDLVYSSGVIHHTPSSKNTFASLVKLTRKGGRLYVWVYRKRAFPIRIFAWVGRSLKSWMSLKSVMTVCQVMAPFYKMGATCLNALGIMKFRPRTTREVTLDLFDAFAPRFNHYHSEAEMRSWFEEHGFTNIQLSGVQKHGIGMFGDKL